MEEIAGFSKYHPIREFKKARRQIHESGRIHDGSFILFKRSQKILSYTA